MNKQSIIPMEPFQSDILLKGAHAQMIAAHLLNRPRESELSNHIAVPLEDGDQLVIMVDSPTQPAAAAGVLLAHGLGGDANAKYMLSLSKRLTEKGYLVFRMNHRGAGQGAGHVSRMYNAGLSGDIRQAVSQIITQYPNIDLICIGFSMSGNTLLKYGGEMGEDVPAPVKGFIAVNPAIDLEQCISAIEQKQNRIYHKRFTKLLLTQLQANREQIELPKDLDRIISIREYDEQVTAPAWEFENALAYYRNESAVNHIPVIARPTVVLTSDDDPIIPIRIFSEVRWPDQTRLTVTQGGGHMGYLARKKTPLGDRRWLDYFLVYSIAALLT